MPEPVIGEGTVVILVCPGCAESVKLTPKHFPTTAGGFIGGTAAAIEKMKKEHECPKPKLELKLV